MRSETHAVAAVPRGSQSACLMRQPLYGGRRVERAFCEMRTAVATECVSERVPEQLSRKSYADM
eukprot:1987310-Lingulodinium_polyedra.AAC.1